MKIIKEENELEKRAKFHRKKQKGMSPFSYLNPNAGNVEKGCEFFNNANTPNISAGGEGSASMGEALEEEADFQRRQKIFNEIRDFNPNADFDFYEYMPIGRMLAIRNSYQRRAEQKQEIEIPEQEQELGEIYYDTPTDSFKIQGLDIEFETELEALTYLRENQ